MKLGSSYGGSIDVNTYTGNFDATGGGTFNFAGGTTAASFNLASNGVLAFSDNVTQNGNVTVNKGNTGTVSVGSGKTATYNGTLSKDGSTLVLGGGGTHVVNGSIVGSSANSDLVVSNSTVTLNSTNSYNGPTFVVAGGRLNNGTNNALPTDTTLTLGQSGETSSTTNTYNLGGYSQTVTSVATAGSAVAVVTNSTGNGNLTLNSSVDNSISNLRMGGSGLTLTKTGTNRVTLVSNNTIGPGTIAIQQGTLLLGAANQIGDATQITLSGGTLNTSGNGDAVGKLTVSANSEIRGLNIGSGSTFTFSDVDLSTYAGWGGSTLTLAKGSGTYAIGDVIRFSSNNFETWSGYNANDLTSLNSFRTKISFDGNASLRAQINFSGGYTTLTVAAIPEPKVYMAAAGLVLLIGAAEVRRRRQRA